MTMDEVIPIVPREARPYQGRRAGLVTRLIAGVIDGVLVVVSLLVAYVGANGLIFLFHPRGFQFSAASPILSVAAGLVLLVLYLTVAWSTIGRTYGCQVMGLRVVSRRGERLRLPVALLRAVLYVMFPIGLFFCAGGVGRRSLQDLVLRTSVIYDWLPRHP
ncbi:putative RDD family membrane protein YckC [Kribbella orskensis]|uniref:RDD family membrane protein YckC n=1 Tax=Kribbella orskensis TaxID=2512216 RepID=A0ABY2BHN5_9ACTN|nr:MULTISPECIES: RDD family protein [Kribbella]TCN36685.1 putative RDD family membrane protein YckC [Kribbella sp. VKM Ac-2500]TCO17924.1 putative RDD family membrane protein YckC [Kribbella orskensis]